MRLNFEKKEMILKIVYFGPSMGGKTTNLQNIHNLLAPDLKSQFVSINTMDDRTLFFDFFDVTTSAKWGSGRIKFRFELYTVPGQVKYEETRKLVMKGADGVVFVADSQSSKMPDNLYSRADLDEILVQYGQSPEAFPIVFQYNKRDLPNIDPIEKMRKVLNPQTRPDFGSIATKGVNIMETLQAVTSEVISASKKKYA